MCHHSITKHEQIDKDRSLGAVTTALDTSMGYQCSDTVDNG
jgi:hypothetical protein